MRRAALSAVTAAALLLGLGACGDRGPGSSLAATDAKLDDIRSAKIDLEFAGASMAAGEVSKPVGFRVRGPFSLESDGDYPVAKFSYTRMLGAKEQTATITSTGTAVFVGDNRVPASQLGGLRLGTGGPSTSGLEGLRLSDWVADPHTTRRGDRDVVTGSVDASESLSDLAAMSRQLGLPTTGELPDLDKSQRARLAKLVRASTIRVESGHRDHVLRSLSMRIDVAPAAGEEDQAALGSLIGARLTLRMTLADVNRPVRVEAPRSG